MVEKQERGGVEMAVYRWIDDDDDDDVEDLRDFLDDNETFAIGYSDDED